MSFILISVHRATEFGDPRMAFLLAPVAVAVGWIGSLIWQRVFIAEMER